MDKEKLGERIGERQDLFGPPYPSYNSHKCHFSFWSTVSHAFDRTQSWGSLRPPCVKGFCRQILRLSRKSKLYWRLVFDLSLNVANIWGFSQSIEPDVQMRACLEIPDMCSSFLLEVTSA